MTLSADVLIRDRNGNTLATAELPGLPYDGFTVAEAHVSDAGTLVVTVNLTGKDEE